MPNNLKPLDQLPIKHQLFVLGMITHKGDKAKAARSAGYSEKTAKQQGTQLFTKLYRYIEPLTQNMVKAYALSAEQVVQGLLHGELVSCINMDSEVGRKVYIPDQAAVPACQPDCRACMQEGQRFGEYRNLVNSTVRDCMIPSTLGYHPAHSKRLVIVRREWLPLCIARS